MKKAATIYYILGKIPYKDNSNAAETRILITIAHLNTLKIN